MDKQQICGESVFDRLTDNLSRAERAEMLDRIQSSLTVSAEPLYQKEDEPAEINLKEEFRSFSFFRKLLLFLKSLFSATTLERQILLYILGRIGRSVESSYPGILDLKRGMLLSPFREEVEHLRESAGWFQNALSAALGSEKSLFIPFLVGLELTELHTKLMEDTDPWLVQENYGFANEHDLRGEIISRLDTALSLVTEDEKNEVFREVRFLYCLKAFGEYPFSRVFTAFRSTGEGDSAVCSLQQVKSLLPELDAILGSLRIVPSLRALEAIYLFIHREDQERGDLRFEEDLKSFSRQAESAFSHIRNFNRQVPLSQIVRCALEEVNYSREVIGGGEEWFSLYRKYWENLIDERLGEFVQENLRRELISDVNDYLHRDSWSYLDSYRPDTGLQLRYSLTLSFISSFYERVLLPELNRPLKKLLIDGDFYKDDNRMEFTDAYDALLESGAAVKKFDARYDVSGDIGASIAQVRNELIPPPLKRKKLQLVDAGGDRDAEKLIGELQNRMRSLICVLGGILSGQPGGRYDTLSNLGFLGGKNGQEFLSSIAKVKSRTESAFSLLSRLYDLEKSC